MTTAVDLKRLRAHVEADAQAGHDYIPALDAYWHAYDQASRWQRAKHRLAVRQPGDRGVKYTLLAVVVTLLGLSTALLHVEFGWPALAGGLPVLATATWHTWAAHTPPNTEQEHTS